MATRGRPRHPGILTPREQEVLSLLREELSNEQIAARLGISLQGAKYHVSEILGKLGVENRAEAARWVETAPAAKRRWWAAVPLLGELRPRWLSPAITIALTIAVAIGIGALVWALVATGGDDEVTPPGPVEPATGASLVLDAPSPVYSSIDFVSEDEGWMLAGGGLLHSGDGGATWSEAARVSGADVDFADAEHGWIVGGSGSILATTDGGATWSAQESGTEVHLSDVEALSASEAWAVGDGQGFSDQIIFPLPTLLLHTKDGGSSWEHVKTPEGGWFSQVQFVGDTGWAVGSWCELSEATGFRGAPACGGGMEGAVLRTTDRGESWLLLDTALPWLPGNAVFVNESSGWLTGSCAPKEGPCPIGLYSTRDGGETWQFLETLGYRSMGPLGFRDAEQGWAVAQEEVESCPCEDLLLSTDDGAKTWSRVGTIGGSSEQYIYRLQLTETGLYLLGEYAALRSLDGGRSLEELATPAVKLGRLDFVDENVGFTVRDGGMLLRTEDGGLTWERVGPTPGYASARVDFVDAVHGFAIDNGQALQTADGGRTWEEVYDSTEAGFVVIPEGWELKFADLNHGWLLDNDAIFVTEDGGRSWYESSPQPHGAEFQAMQVADETTAWAVVAVEIGNFAPKRLVRTTDGGRSWEAVRDISGYGEVFDAVDDASAWYVTTVCGPCRDALVVTHDGGAGWTEVDLGERRVRVQDIEFTDGRNGWITATVCRDESGCGSAILLRTSDGGLTWTEVPLEQPFWGDLVFVDAGTGWLQALQVGFGQNETTVSGRTLLFQIR